MGFVRIRVPLLLFLPCTDADRFATSGTFDRFDLVWFPAGLATLAVLLVVSLCTEPIKYVGL